MKRPEDVIPHLGKGELHWKEGRSAKLLADQWFAAKGLPESVRGLIEQAEPFVAAVMLEGWTERETELPWGKGRPTQTDLLALLKLGNGELAVLGIEAKVDETLGPLVGEWLATGGDNRAERLAGLCGMFGPDPASAIGMRYQLFHRIAGSVLEARRFGATQAVVLVQSWCPMHTGLDAFAAFAEAIGLTMAAGRLSEPTTVEGVELRIGWLAEATR